MIDLEANKVAEDVESPRHPETSTPFSDAMPDVEPVRAEPVAAEQPSTIGFDKLNSDIDPVKVEPLSETPVSETPVIETPASQELASETPRAEASPNEAPQKEAWRNETPRSREPKRPSIVPALAALVVAILAAGWIYLYNEMSALQGDSREQIVALQTKIASLESRPAPDLGGLNQRIDSTAAQAQVGLQALSRRVDGLQSAAGADPRQIQAVQSEVAAVKTSVGALQDKVAALPKPDLSRVDREVGDMGQKLAQVQSTVAAIPRVDLGPLTGRVDGLTSKVDGLAGKVEGLAGRLDGVETRLKPIEAEAEAARSPQRVAERRAAPVAVTAQAIVEAIAAGQAFPREFAALQALGADPVKLAPLQTVAGTGAPSLADLQASLADLRKSIVAQGTPAPTGSYIDRIMAGAGSLVQVRPLGSVVGDTPAAIVARMNDDIGSDNLAAALREWNALPEASRNASKALADRLRVRLEAEEAAKSIAANAIGAMAASRG